MSNLLLVNSSFAAETSVSRRVANEFVAAWRVAHPDASVVARDLAAGTMPHLTAETFGAASTPADKRTAAQHQAVAFADTLISEVETADTIVIAAPMYNFSIPSTLKAWFDHLARVGRTFGYGATGPFGLLKNKRVIVVSSRGGNYTGDTPMRALDLQEPYIRVFFKFLGIEDVHFIHVEGQGRGPEVAEQGLSHARAVLTQLAPKALAA